MKVYYTRDNVQNIDGFDRHAYPESIGYCRGRQ